LTRKIGELPGSVYFTLPSGAQDDAVWAQIIEGTTALCDCGQRRLLCPTQGRSWFIPHSQNSYPVVGSTVYVGPHNSDTTMAYTRVTVVNGQLIVQSLDGVSEPTTYWLGQFEEHVRTRGPLVLTHETAAGITVPIAAIKPIERGVRVTADRGARVSLEERTSHTCA
jgi:hypothetical protein